MTVEEFNQAYKVGQSVSYHPIIGQAKSKPTRTRSQAWTLPSGEDVIQVEGKAGCVALAAISITCPDSSCDLPQITNGLISWCEAGHVFRQ